jgi:hypothetical protein
MATRSRNFRCDDDLWAAAKEAAVAEGRTVTDVIVAALRRLVAAEAMEAKLGELAGKMGKDVAEAKVEADAQIERAVRQLFAWW